MPRCDFCMSPQLSTNVFPLILVSNVQALISLYVFATLKLYRDAHHMGLQVLDNVLWVWFGGLTAELACLIFKYYFGKYCCCCFSCCVPTTYSLLDEDECGEDDKV